MVGIVVLGGNDGSATRELTSGLHSEKAKFNYDYWIFRMKTEKCRLKNIFTIIPFPPIIIFCSQFFL